jgi:hypothetical protein
MAFGIVHKPSVKIGITSAISVPSDRHSLAKENTAGLKPASCSCTLSRALPATPRGHLDKNYSFELALGQTKLLRGGHGRDSSIII